MRILVCLTAAALLMAGAAAAQTSARTVEVDLWNFKFDPDALTLQAGQPYVLHLVNQSDSRHDFTAKAFFAAARIAEQDRGAVVDGKVDLAPNSSRDIHLTAPPAGSFEARCSKFLHAHLGMKAAIVVR